MFPGTSAVHHVRLIFRPNVLAGPRVTHPRSTLRRDRGALIASHRARVRVLVASPQSAAPSLPASLPPPGRRRPVSSGVPSRSEGRRLPGLPSPEDPRPRPHPDGGPCARRNMWWRNCKMKIVRRDARAPRDARQETRAGRRAPGDAPGCRDAAISPAPRSRQLCFVAIAIVLAYVLVPLIIQMQSDSD